MVVPGLIAGKREGIKMCSLMLCLVYMMCVLSSYLSGRLRPEGPWWQRHCLFYTTIVPPPTGIVVLAGLPSLLLPMPPRGKDKTKGQRERNEGKVHSQEKAHYQGGPGPASSLSLSPPSSSGGHLRATKHPTLVLLKKSSTSSVALSFQSSLAEGARGCFHQQAFPMSLQDVYMM